MNDLIKKIHATDKKAVLAIAGGGSEAIGELLRYGDGSKTLLNAVVPYSTEAFDRYIKGKPDKYVSEDAACYLAMAAYEEATSLAPNEEVVGIGVTASLGKSGPERAGRVHELWIASQSVDETITKHVVFNENTTISREREETEAATIIIEHLAKSMGIYTPDAERHYTGQPYWAYLYSDNTVRLSTHDMPRLKLSTPDTINDAPQVVFPGSFNPFHRGHITIIQAASNIAKLHFGLLARVDLEISVHNFSKPAICYKHINERTACFAELKRNIPCLGELWFTNAPLFTDKAKLFPKAVFVIGMDTFERLNKHGVIDEINSRFIVFPRTKPIGTIHELADIENLNKKLADRCYFVPKEEYAALGLNQHISSTEMRKLTC